MDGVKPQGSLVEVLGSVIAELLLGITVDRARDWWRDKPVEAAIRSTAEAFPRYPGLATTLWKWASSPSVCEALVRMSDEAEDLNAIGDLLRACLAASGFDELSDIGQADEVLGQFFIEYRRHLLRLEGTQFSTGLLLRRLDAIQQSQEALLDLQRAIHSGAIDPSLPAERRRAAGKLMRNKVARNEIDWLQKARPVSTSEAADVLANALTVASDRSYTLFYCDIDGMSNINRVHGPEVASRVVLRVGANIVSQLHPRGVFHVRGDQFMSMFEGGASAGTSCRAAADKCLRRIQQLSWNDVAPHLYVSCSIGLAPAGQAGESSDEWLIRAMLAVRLAKQRGRNEIVVAPVSIPPFYSRDLLYYDS